jgi:hypothetical protein
MIHRHQVEVLFKARQLYPNFKLKDWSEQTGIQLTRIFRIFHGKEMTLNEYMSFHDLILRGEKKPLPESLSEFSNLSKKSLELLPINLIDQINLNLKYHLENFFIIQGKFKELY